HKVDSCNTDLHKLFYTPGLNFGGYKAQINYYVIALFGKYYQSQFDADYIWKNQTISPEVINIITDLANKVWEHFQNPVIKGVNISQWCKKEECWQLLQSRYQNHEL
ncbi:AIPR family protein, partial [uncultured Megasphaera sp.]|uniref:AIPR family protein n=1 Tax=uncultured Megasphaera sp. TaxID=165188 RepID=UPI00267412D6